MSVHPQYLNVATGDLVSGVAQTNAIGGAYGVMAPPSLSNLFYIQGTFDPNPTSASQFGRIQHVDGGPFTVSSQANNVGPIAVALPDVSAFTGLRIEVGSTQSIVNTFTVAMKA